ncbi:MAG: GTPase HflX, partial [Gemmatimonadetes bacterium]|nr:GTPase HflX [Gemmatimonadota bacterium]
MRALIDTRPKPERAVLVGAPRRRTADGVHADEHLDELASLADTAGAQVVGRLQQRIAAPAPKSYIGAGKVAELRELAESTEASLVVFDEELSPAQGKNLEAALDRRVMDRAELILDIFATRARSK